MNDLPMPSLTHYTRSADAVRGILTNGFALVANPRLLAKQLIPEHDFSNREPQQFGMVSFTELRPSEAAAHRQAFGSFGIVVTKSWARTHQAQRVVYVDKSGPLADAMRQVFALGYEDLQSRIKHPDDAFWRMAYENKAVAGAIAGAQLWASLLSIWDYLETGEHAAQREWRVVSGFPEYSLLKPTSDVIADISPPQGWAHEIRLLKFSPADVEHLICRPQDRNALLSALPGAYQAVPIIETDL